MSATITFESFTGATASGSWLDIAGQAGFVALAAVGTANTFPSNLIQPQGSKATFNADWFIDATADTRVTDRINVTWSTTAGVANRALRIKYRNTTNGSFTNVKLTVWQANNQTGRTGIVSFDQTNNQFQAARVGSKATASGTYTIGSSWAWGRIGAATTLTLAQGVAGTAGFNNNDYAIINCRVKINTASQAGDDISAFVTTSFDWT